MFITILVVSFGIITVSAVYTLIKGSSLFLLLPVSVLFPLLVPIINFYFKRGDSEEVTILQEENKKIQQRLFDNPNASVIDSVQLQLNQIREYYILNKNQSANSFIVSIVAFLIGLALIAFAVVFLLVDGFKNLQVSTISGINSIILNFIAGTFFIMYRRAMSQLNYFYNQLLSTQDTMLAIKLTQEYPETAKKAELMEKIIMMLLERSSNQVNKTNIINP